MPPHVILAIATLVVVSTFGGTSRARAYVCADDFVPRVDVDLARGSAILPAGRPLRLVLTTGDCKSSSAVLRAGDLEARMARSPTGRMTPLALRDAGRHVDLVIDEPGEHFVEITVRGRSPDQLIPARLVVVTTARGAPTELVRARVRLDARRSWARHLVLEYQPAAPIPPELRYELPTVTVRWRGQATTLPLTLPRGRYRVHHGRRSREKLSDVVPPINVERLAIDDALGTLTVDGAPTPVTVGP